MKKLKYLWAYSAENEEAKNWHSKLIHERIEKGYDIKPFCLTPDYLNNGQWIPYYRLDELWKIGYEPLLRMYHELLIALEDRDVLIHYNGANIHKDIITKIQQFKVYTCGDDPESTDNLSKPVAKYYDICLVNNIAVVDMYKSWGIKNVFFQPLGSKVFPQEISIDENDILDISKRNIKLAYVGEYNAYKKELFDLIVSRFPDARCYGNGWSKGKIADSDMIELYYGSQMGFNVHNSSGPINFRLYELPAYGVMQLCDNKGNLDDVFKLGEEVIGFDTAEECIKQIEYYWNHEKEQREIALNGWNRWKNEYTPMAVWERMARVIDEYYLTSNVRTNIDLLDQYIYDQRKRHPVYKAMYSLRRLVK